MLKGKEKEDMTLKQKVYFVNDSVIDENNLI